MSLIRRIPRIESPPDGVGIDFGSPFANGLVEVVSDAGGIVTAARNGVITRGSTVAAAASVGFVSSIGAGKSTSYRGDGFTDFHTVGLSLDGATALTLLGVVRRSADTSVRYSGPFGLTGPAGPVAAMETGSGFFPNAATYFSLWDSSGTRFNKLETAELAPLETLQVVVIRLSASNMDAFFNGRLVGSPASGPATLRTISYVEKGSAAGLVFGGQVPLVAVWNRALSDVAIADISENPWQLFEPRRIFVPMFVASSGVPVLSAATAFNVTATTAQPRVTITF